QASPIEYTYQCVGTYDSVATVANIESPSAADDKITFTATVADIASYGLNQPVVFAGPNVTNAGLLPATTYYVKSTDAGETWQAKTNGTPTGTSRLAIDVTIANPEVIYIFAADPNNNFKGIYKSVDAGDSFVFTSGGAADVFDGASQSWYD
ncbi:MAG: hypothetical protein ACKVJK_23670, partial [Methylophagaceae bacterium]